VAETHTIWTIVNSVVRFFLRTQNLKLIFIMLKYIYAVFNITFFAGTLSTLFEYAVGSKFHRRTLFACGFDRAKYAKSKKLFKWYFLAGAVHERWFLFKLDTWCIYTSSSCYCYCKISPWEWLLKIQREIIVTKVWYNHCNKKGGLPWQRMKL